MIFLLNNQVLNSKLSSNSDVPCAEIESLILYDGSIIDFDSRLYGFDIGTCLEVTSSCIFILFINFFSGYDFDKFIYQVNGNKLFNTYSYHRRPFYYLLFTLSLEFR